MKLGFWLRLWRMESSRCGSNSGAGPDKLLSGKFATNDSTRHYYSSRSSCCTTDGRSYSQLAQPGSSATTTTTLSSVHFLSLALSSLSRFFLFSLMKSAFSDLLVGWPRRRAFLQ